MTEAVLEAVQVSPQANIISRATKGLAPQFFALNGSDAGKRMVFPVDLPLPLVEEAGTCDQIGIIICSLIRRCYLKCWVPHSSPHAQAGNLRCQEIREIEVHVSLIKTKRISESLGT